MSDPVQPSKEELIAKAWKRWREIDFSWEGLKIAAIIKENEDYEDAYDPKLVKYGLELQNYWLKDPQTLEIRSEQQLIETGELIKSLGQKTYHLAHLPLHYDDGTPTRKTTEPEAVREQLDHIRSYPPCCIPI